MYSQNERGMVMKKHKTNSAFVKSAMQNSQYGAIKETFIVAALDTYARLVLSDQVKNPMGGFIDNQLWLDVATELKQELSTQYGS